LRLSGYYEYIIYQDTRPGVLLRTDPQTDLAIIPYLEDSINRTRKLITCIIKRVFIFQRIL
jgi:hypothetical protein